MSRRAWLADQDPSILVADGFDDAIIGVIHTVDGRKLAVYDAQRVVDQVETECESRCDAEDFCAFNIWGAYVGPGTPLFVEIMNQAHSP